MENPSLSKNQSLRLPSIKLASGHTHSRHDRHPFVTHSFLFFFPPFPEARKRGLKQATLTREFKTTRCHDTPETKRPGYRLQEKFFVINVSLPAHIRTYPILGRRTPFLITATNRADGGRSNKLSWNIDPLLSLSLSL